jgi:hypothetical protein
MIETLVSETHGKGTNTKAKVTSLEIRHGVAAGSIGC